MSYRILEKIATNQQETGTYIDLRIVAGLELKKGYASGGHLSGVNSLCLGFYYYSLLIYPEKSE